MNRKVYSVEIRHVYDGRMAMSPQPVLPLTHLEPTMSQA